MTPKKHQTILLIFNILLYVLTFLAMYLFVVKEIVSRDYIIALFIALLTLIYFANMAFKALVKATCPKCGENCKIVGRSPIYYRCTDCEFSMKGRLFENGEDHHNR